MSRNITYIPAELSYEAREIYGKQRALKDLLLTIPFYEEKKLLEEKVNSELNDVELDIEDWWKRVSEITKKEFSENAEIFFDSATIVD